METHRKRSLQRVKLSRHILIGQVDRINVINRIVQSFLNTDALYFTLNHNTSDVSTFVHSSGVLTSMPALTLTRLDRYEFPANNSDTRPGTRMHEFNLISVIRCDTCATWMVSFHQNGNYEIAKFAVANELAA